MRGKNILWISLIATLVLTMLPILPAIVSAPCDDCRLYIDPPTMEGVNPGEFFTVNVNVENVCDLWGAGFKVQFQPYGLVFVVSSVTEGDFLKQGGYKTYFLYAINVFKGYVDIGVSRLATSGLPIEGASGNGTLVTVTFQFIEAGGHDITLEDVALVDSDIQQIDCDVEGFHIEGIELWLSKITSLGLTRTVGQTQEFKATVKNPNAVPLLARVRWTMVRQQDNAIMEFYTPDPAGRDLWVESWQPYADWADTWLKVGDEPYLHADESSYIESNNETAWAAHESGAYAFEDQWFFPLEDTTPLLAREIILSATLDVLYADLGDGTAGETDMVDCYIYSPGTGFFYIDSVGYTAAATGPEPQWRNFDLPAALRDIGAINEAMVGFEFWPWGSNWDNYPGWPPCGPDFATFRIHGSKIHLDIAAQCKEREAMFLAPVAYGPLTMDDVGTWVASAIVEYSYTGLYWSEGVWKDSNRPQSFVWNVYP